MLDFDRLRAPPIFGRPQRPPFHLVYGPYRHEMGVPRFRRPHRPIPYSTKVQGPKQLYPRYFDGYLIVLCCNVIRQRADTIKRD